MSTRAVNFENINTSMLNFYRAQSQLRAMADQLHQAGHVDVADAIATIESEISPKLARLEGAMQKALSTVETATAVNAGGE